jgi:hypothetical protein
LQAYEALSDLQHSLRQTSRVDIEPRVEIAALAHSSMNTCSMSEAAISSSRSFGSTCLDYPPLDEVTPRSFAVGDHSRCVRDASAALLGVCLPLPLVHKFLTYF